jgi:hypothetical protein
MPAGFGTEHSGIGLCETHDESTPTPQERLAAADPVTHDLAQLAQEMSIEPHDAMLWAARLAAGELEFWIQVLKQDPTNENLVHYHKARQEASRLNKAAIDAGVQERTVALRERMSLILATALDEILSQLPLSMEQKALLPGAIHKALSSVEMTGTRLPDVTLDEYGKALIPRTRQLRRVK